MVNCHEYPSEELVKLCQPQLIFAATYWGLAIRISIVGSASGSVISVLKKELLIPALGGMNLRLFFFTLDFLDMFNKFCLVFDPHLTCKNLHK